MPMLHRSGRHRQNGGRLEIGMMGAIRSERWAASDRNRWAAYVRIRTDPFAVLHRSGHPLGERRPRLRAAAEAAAVMCAVFSDDQWRRLGEIEHLPGNMAGCHGRSQRFTARRARFWIMVDGGIR